MLGTPGDPTFIQAHLEKKADEQRTLLESIPMVTDLQSAWLILLHCASARANHLLRVAAYARAHDEGVWTCMCALLNINTTQEEDIRSCANLPKCLGVLGKLGRLFAHDVRQTPWGDVSDRPEVGGPP